MMRTWLLGAIVGSAWGLTGSYTNSARQEMPWRIAEAPSQDMEPMESTSARCDP